MLRKITQNEYALSFWSGGTTAQIAIYPEDASYADRDFLWRVSSASVDRDESVFTPLPDYDRKIAAVAGELVLSIEGEEPVALKPFEVFSFDGGAKVSSRGRCADFNLMTRKDRVKGELISARAQKKEKLFGVDLLAGETAVVYLAKGRAEVFCGFESEAVRAGESCLYVAGWECSLRLRLAADSVAMIAVMSRVE